jgi:hypothetical protein
MRYRTVQYSQETLSSIFLLFSNMLIFRRNNELYPISSYSQNLTYIPYLHVGCMDMDQPLTSYLDLHIVSFHRKLKVQVQFKSDATLYDGYFALCYVLSQYP